jgi:uncharacterized RDD family membrane protein YckC
MEQQYYILSKSTNQSVGPMSESEVRQWISQRLLTDDDMIARVGDASWLPISQSSFAPLVTTNTTGSYPSANREMGRPLEYMQAYQANPQISVQQDNSILFQRFVALLIDGLCAFPLMILAVLPVISLIGTPLLVAYFLSRDILSGNGQSIGKRVMGLKVKKTDGSPVTWIDSFQRNIVYLIFLAYFAFTIPGLGWIIVIVLKIPSSLLSIAEVLSVLVTGRRLGDHLNGKTFVTKAY